jgi:hypothetical protein
MKAVLALVVVLIASQAFAQTNPVPVSQPFQVQYDHDGLNVTGFQCGLDGKPLGGVLGSTARACGIPGLSAGQHTITVEAINAFGRTASVPVTATAGTPPNAPTNLRISFTVAVTADGRVDLLAANVEKLPVP